VLLGVPLLLTISIGAMAVYSDHERVFDEATWSFSSVLASEAK